MTRFARAKGSKASNLKSPEDSTPWEVLKEQLLKSKKENEESKNREEAEKQRIDNYNNFLKDQRTQKRKATWCEFPEAVINNNRNITQNESEKSLKIKKKKLNKQNESSALENVQNSEDCNGSHETKEPKKKKLDNIVSSAPENNSNHQQKANISTDKNQDSEHETQKTSKKKKKKKKQTQLVDVKTGNDNSDKEVNQIENKNIQNNNIRQKNKNKKQKVSEVNIGSEQMQSDKSKNKIEHVKPHSQSLPLKKKKDKKGRRKPVDDKSFHLVINSKDVQLVRFDGFPIMKRDADRLSELKASMIKKGIPKSEVQRTMKLERRRAEKALARLKRDVCYNCRKGGHNLSDCPDLKTNIPGSGAEGLCFKCGSTEHRQFECKVQRDKEFRFATCFICKEAGHIARQCPDNPKGLYPNGGCCKLCGDVTHLRKDCPTVNEKKESTSIKLQILSDNNIEDIGQNDKPASEEHVSKKPKKIKF